MDSDTLTKIAMAAIAAATPFVVWKLNDRRPFGWSGIKADLEVAEKLPLNHEMRQWLIDYASIRIARKGRKETRRKPDYFRVALCAFAVLFTGLLAFLAGYSLVTEWHSKSNSANAVGVGFVFFLIVSPVLSAVITVNVYRQNRTSISERLHEQVTSYLAYVAPQEGQQNDTTPSEEQDDTTRSERQQNDTNR